MDNTGRIRETLLPEALRAIYRATREEDFPGILPFLVQVDLAHLLMLKDQGILGEDQVRRVLKAIARLEEERFEPLRSVPTPRGIYLAYESYLIEVVGADGGILQTGRSRNDLNATTLRLRLRIPFMKLLEDCLQVVSSISSRAAKWSEMTMPIYTHGQAAMPGSFGHYLSGVGHALVDDLEGLLFASKELQRSPLGAGASGGTDLPIDQRRTAALLGFSGVSVNSIEAVASRQFVLRILSGLSILGVTVSRLASDFSMWSTSEFGFLSFPDTLVGSSSAMPQKRNPFPLEHIEGRSAQALGAFVEALAAMRSAPFSNSIAVGTEGVHSIWEALSASSDMLVLCRLVVEYARPDRERMNTRAIEGYTVATALANREAIREGKSFRAVHKALGSRIREEIDAEIKCDRGVRTELLPHDAMIAANFGGGPGLEAHRRSLRHLRSRIRGIRRRVRHLVDLWCKADAELEAGLRQIGVKRSRMHSMEGQAESLTYLSEKH